MPIFIEWKWEEGAKSLLAIFHFYDDFSRHNLRLMEYDEEREAYIFSQKRLVKPERSWITWAPSHIEMALLMQMLCYANMINGLKPSEKRELWTELEGKRTFANKGFSKVELANISVPDEIKRYIGIDKKVMAYADSEDKEVLRTCAELCPEYIDYLRKLLKPYLR
jgi:hypothetical protein